jgi:ankyrin repeat protein
MWATHKSDLKIMKILLGGGADVDRKTHGGYTALMHARTPQAAQLLLHAGADPNLLNDAGYTAWHHARDNHWHKVAAVIKRAQTRTDQIKG